MIQVYDIVINNFLGGVWVEGRIYYLQQVKRTPGIMSQNVSQNCKIGEVLN